MTNQVTKLFSYEGNKVTFKTVEGVVYVNATQMAKSFGKKPNDYLRLPGTVELIQACARKSRTSENQLVIAKMGSAENGGGTWLQEDIAIDFAQWLSIDFRLWCNDRLKELLNYGITATDNTIENILNNPENQIKLLQALKDERDMKIAAQNQASTLENKIIKQQPAIDYVTNVIRRQGCYTTNEVALSLGMSVQALNKALVSMKIQYGQSGIYQLHAEYRNKGYVSMRTPEGASKSYMVWTESGKVFIHSKLNPIMIRSFDERSKSLNLFE